MTGFWRQALSDFSKVNRSRSDSDGPSGFSPDRKGLSPKSESLFSNSKCKPVLSGRLLRDCAVFTVQIVLNILNKTGNGTPGRLFPESDFINKNKHFIYRVVSLLTSGDWKFFNPKSLNVNKDIPYIKRRYRTQTKRFIDSYSDLNGHFLESEVNKGSLLTIYTDLKVNNLALEL